MKTLLKHWPVTTPIMAFFLYGIYLVGREHLEGVMFLAAIGASMAFGWYWRDNSCRREIMELQHAEAELLERCEAQDLLNNQVYRQGYEAAMATKTGNLQQMN